MELCCDPKTTIVVLSGSNKFVLDNNFCEYKMWLAAENGNFLRSTTGKWMTTIPENLNLDWIDCIKPVFEYFTERTPQSQFEVRNTSLVWNYKYADVKFGRVQAIDLLQHLCESLSNAHVDVIQGSRSVEVRAGGVTKGAGIHRILEEIAYNSVSTQIDYVLCIGHFLGKDEDLYTYFEALKFPGDRMSDLKLQNSGSVSKASQVTSEQPLPNSGKKTLWNVLDLMMENYFSCTVDRTQSRARYSLGSSDDVVSLLKALAAASSSS
ncbi:Trehalose-6-phosphate synthase12 [Heracleum sosnowskyi]|uniref:Trehalose-6-phosphate synthase12 n=1 Tax=Heracleum sosnowskyi TaxID=360622 RepID=A0AAD8M7L9_9APIA|nr:Trehalose-6-phosphate synthase12 [Heracleum sosnowskyi]